MASTSASTGYGGNNKFVFDVFLNHRGPDVKSSLATDLYNRLCQHKLQVFLDVRELQEGEEITLQIESAIGTAYVQIAIFSKHYAESTWCLNKLLLMLESRSTILPIFYHVKPSELRWTQGTDGVYARALRTLEDKNTFDSETQQERPGYNSDTIAKWRKALSKVADISGFDLETYNRDERQLVEKVVEKVLEIVPKKYDVSKYPRGLDEKVKDFESKVLQQQQSDEVRVRGIGSWRGWQNHLAKEFFNRKGPYYKQSCFLFDIREKSLNSLHSLQSKLLEDLAPNNKNVQISSTDDGKVKLRRYLSSSQALIILDDVDHLDQLDALLLPVKDALDSRSLILVTSRDKGVLTSFGIPESFIYRLTGLNPQQSKELFCCHAFGQPRPDVRFEEVIQGCLVVCNGLPLSLKVIGALLASKKDLALWEGQLRKISKILPNDIKSTLKISYDSLDEEEKQIFLDVACFFIGEDRDTAIRIWHGYTWEGLVGLQNLENKCLIDVDSNKRIRMHDHLRDLGRDIGMKERLYRLWRVNDNLIHHLPKESIVPVRGINMVDISAKIPADLGNCLPRMSGLKLVIVAGDCLDESIFRSMQSDLIYLRWERYPHSCLPLWIPMDSLRVLHVLKALELDTLWEDEKAPPHLRELIIDNLKDFPNSVWKLKNLEKLELTQMGKYTSELFTSKPIRELRNLKQINLSYSSMRKLPKSFGNLMHLKEIKLSFCISLKWLPVSFQKLKNIQHLNIYGCLELRYLSVEHLTSLRTIDAGQCNRLEGMVGLAQLTKLPSAKSGTLRQLKRTSRSQTSERT